MLLVEAGENENSLSDVVRLSGVDASKMDWGYEIEPQQNGFTGKQI